MISQMTLEGNQVLTDRQCGILLRKLGLLAQGLLVSLVLPTISVSVAPRIASKLGSPYLLIGQTICNAPLILYISVSEE